jgi:hypothetical protein
MATLQEFVPSMRFPLPRDFEFRKLATSTSTASYSLSIPPPSQEGRPAFLVHDSSLPARMLGSLRSYLQTVCQDRAPSDTLINALSYLTFTVGGYYGPGEVHTTMPGYALGHESTTTTLFDRVLAPISSAVWEVDQNAGIPERAPEMAAYNQTPDAIYIPYPGGPQLLHLEMKSWSAFSKHSEDIVRLASTQAVLELGDMERGHRSIIFKVLMLTCPGRIFHHLSDFPIV